MDAEATITAGTRSKNFTYINRVVEAKPEKSVALLAPIGTMTG